MSFLIRAMVGAFFMLALLSSARAQAPVQASSQASALPPDDDFYSVREHAAAGNAQAQFALGNRYFSGAGVPQDYGQALLWFMKSADQGFAPAQNQLGYMYQHKFGVPRDYKRAVAYYRSAAKQGYALGQYNVGGMFEDGVGVKRDYKQALDWYRKAAEQNLPQAEKQVGYFYQCGYGVKQDYAQAHDWYLRAAGQGNSDAENQLGFFAEEGWGQPKNYAEALAWFYKAAEHGSNDAEENIGYMFQNGLGVQTDYAKAMSWYVEAAAHGNSNAENQIGWMYQFGQGVQEDDARAVTWYRMSADLGNRRGAINLDAFQKCAGDSRPGKLVRRQHRRHRCGHRPRSALGDNPGSPEPHCWIGRRRTKPRRSCQPTRTHRQRQERRHDQAFQCGRQRPRRQVSCRGCRVSRPSGTSARRTGSTRKPTSTNCQPSYTLTSSSLACRPQGQSHNGFVLGIKVHIG